MIAVARRAECRARPLRGLRMMQASVMYQQMSEQANSGLCSMEAIHTAAAPVPPSRKAALAIGDIVRHTDSSNPSALIGVVSEVTSAPKKKCQTVIIECGPRQHAYCTSPSDPYYFDANRHRCKITMSSVAREETLLGVCA